MAQHFVTIAQFRDLPSAGLAQSTLEAAGIQCFLDNQYTIGVNWLYSNALGGVKLRVAAADAKRAKELLQIHTETNEVERVHDEELLPASACPNCGATEIKTINYQRQFSAWSLLLGLPLLFFGKRYRCRKCDHKWK
ncbi:DUF2007 domain-containing protein [Desulfuromonas sp. AOP6]|uniref:putative signal transducing protein n=1 Tax=Desulfuromonas sp. AOP6 TaxID=1566351 RepID=UPI0012DCFC05|nr:DUF2007 domain-containing protein [Desulfuromonas sp. AOP6]